MSDLIHKGKLFNALANAHDKGEIFSIIQDFPTANAVRAERLKKAEAERDRAIAFIRKLAHETDHECDCCRHAYDLEICKCCDLHAKNWEWSGVMED